MSKKHRAQILLDPQQHRKLAEIADEQGDSISGIVRAAIDEWLEGHGQEMERQKRLEALEIVLQHRQAVLARRDGVVLDLDSAEILNQVRDERADELFAGFFDQGN